MNPVARFENFIERLMERTFTRATRSTLQPVEIGKRLVRAMESQQSVGVEGIIVPNVYDVYLSHIDFEHFQPAERSLTQNMEAHVARTARQRRYTLMSKPVVHFHEDERTRPGDVRVVPHLEDVSQELGVPQYTQMLPQLDLDIPEAGPKPPAIVLEGQTFEILRTPTSLGRQADNDIVVNDQRVSRHHAEIIMQGKEWALRDLNSTNGIAVNGKIVKEATLKSGDTISLGGVEVRWEQ